MKTNILFIIAVLLGLSLASCSDNIDETVQSNEVVRFAQSGIDKVEYKTRNMTEWVEGDVVGISYDADPKRYVTNGEGMLIPSENEPIYWQNEPTNAKFTAFYPYSDKVTIREDNKQLDVEFSKEVRPLLWSEAKNVKKGDLVLFQFHYMVVPIEVHVETQGISKEDVEKIKVSVMDSPVGLTLNYKTGETTLREKGTYEVLKTKELKEEARNVYRTCFKSSVALEKGESKHLELEVVYPKKDGSEGKATVETKETYGLGQGLRLHLMMDKGENIVVMKEASIDPMEDERADEQVLPQDYNRIVGYHLNYIRNHSQRFLEQSNGRDRLQGAILYKWFYPYDAKRPHVFEAEVNPYFSNFSAQALLAFPTYEHQVIVKEWLEWYWRHLNDGSEVSPQMKDPIDGSVWDYQYVKELIIDEDGKETGDYKIVEKIRQVEQPVFDDQGKDTGKKKEQNYLDSTDSYAATFLSLLRMYASLSPENLEYVKSHKAEINRIYGSMMATWNQERHMTGAKPSWDMNYLMDNSEVNKAFTDCIYLVQKGCLDASEEKIIDQRLKQSSYGINQGCYVVPKKGGYTFYFGLPKEKVIDFSKIYPDAMAQVFPVVFKVNDGVSQEAFDEANQTVYKKLCDAFPNWQNGAKFGDEKKEPFAHTIIFRGAAAMKDYKRVNDYIRFLDNERMNINTPYGEQLQSWYIAESAHILMGISRCIDDMPIVEDK